MIIDELIAILGYKVEGEGELKKFNDGLDQTEASARKAGSSIGGVARTAGTAALAIGAAGAAVATAATKDYAAFERQMTRIGITAGASSVETAAAADEIQRLAGSFALPLDQAISGLDTLVASGMSLQQAMSFLPSVLATAQAAGASTADIANTAQKAASALGIQASQLQRAFDIMVVGGKAGQFELKDMAAYIPELANSFASLGYTGEDGLKRLIALLQTIREDTGSASSAAYQAQNVFGKIFAPQTINAFDKQFGVDLEARLKEATARGEDIIDAFVRISRETIGGDLSKLPQLFTDQEFRLGMQSLITSEESFRRFMEEVNGAKVTGTVFNDLQTVLNDTQATLDRTTQSWDRFWSALGRASSGPVTTVLDAATNNLDAGDAVRRQLAKEGMGYWQREGWIAMNNPLGVESETFKRKARQGGYVPAGDDVAAQTAKDVPFAYEVLGRRPAHPNSRVDPYAEQRRKYRADAGRYAGEQARYAEMGARYRDSGSGDSSALLSAIAGVDAQVGQLLAASPPADGVSWAANMEAVLSKISGGQATEAVVNDNRQDNRQYPVSVQAPVTVNVQQAAQAPAAVGGAVAGAINQAAQAQPSRMQTGPAQ